MTSSTKLSGEERRAAIIKAVRRVFAEKGFHGTTTRDLAHAAGVSEALLFKHFPNKEALYAAMQHECYHVPHSEIQQWLETLEPSTKNLVALIHHTIGHILSPCVSSNDEESLQNYLVLRSLTEDGELARLVLCGLADVWVRKVEACVTAAIASGDAVGGPGRPRLRGWFAHNVGGMLWIQLRPATPVVDYEISREHLVEEAVWFVLRGIGLKEEVIRRHYTPEAMQSFHQRRK